MKTDIWKKIFVSAGAALSVIMIIIGNVNDIFSFFEMMKQIFNGASLPIKFLYVGLIIVGVGVLVGVVIFSIVHIRRKEKKMRLMNEFLEGVQSYKEKKTTDYVKPFVSKSFDYLMAKNSQGASQYNAEKMMAEGIEVYEYQAALAKKIARADDVNSCMKAYELLDQVINSWHVFINKEKKLFLIGFLSHCMKKVILK